MQKILTFLLTIFILIGLVAPVSAGPTNTLLDGLNPTPYVAEFLIGDLLTGILPITITFAGMILVVFIVMGGYQMLTSPTNPQAQEAGKQKITWAIVGFLIVFSAYWIMQIIEVMFGFNVLG